MDTNKRRSRLFELPIDSNLYGAEIGPLDRPLVDKSECQVVYVDHLNTANLRKKYELDPGVNQKDIVEVDLVWKGSYSEIFSGTKELDFVVACHVIEHVPDFINFLHELSQVMKVGGRLYLVIPDKQFTFDFLRQNSTISEILAANLMKLEKPSVFQIMNELVFASEYSILDGWGRSLKKHSPKPSRTLAEALEIAMKIDFEKSYFDVHCWVFTPQSFVKIIDQLNELELIHFRITNLVPTARFEFEFYCELEKTH